MKRPCACDKATGPVYTVDQCRRCWKWRYDPAYNAYYGGTGRSQIAPIAPVITRIQGLPPCRSFNGSIARWRGKTYLAYRKYWSNARIALVELGEDWQPVGLVKTLTFGKLPQDRDAQEDPRLFLHRDQLCLAYVGCNWQIERPVSVCVARLNEEKEIQESFYPHFSERGRWEKNWSWFDHDGDLYAIYETNPHRAVMENHGEVWEMPRLKTHSFAANAFELMRGGASPVRYNGEYYHFFHGAPRDRSRCYSIGLYTFEAKCPFYPKRWIPLPLLLPDAIESPGPHVANVVFPGGAILRDGKWHVSYGYYDQEIRIASWPLAEIESLLIAV